MDLENKTRPMRTKASFSVPKEILYLNAGVGRWRSKNRKEPDGRQNAAQSLERIFGSSPEMFNAIERKLGLTYALEKEENVNVCMANSPEVRDEYKDAFTAKNLMDYAYAVLYSPCYLEKYKDLSKIEALEISYPPNQNRFWKLASFGAQLRQLHLSESSSVEKLQRCHY